MKSVFKIRLSYFFVFLILISPQSFGGGTGVWPLSNEIWPFSKRIKFGKSINIIAVRLDQNQVNVVVFGEKPNGGYKVTLTEVEHGLLPDPINGNDENKKPTLRLELIKQDDQVRHNQAPSPFVVSIILNSTKDSFWLIKGADKAMEIKISLPS